MMGGQPVSANGLLVAVFEDGTVFGDPSAVKSILDERRNTRQALDLLLKHLQGQNGNTLADVGRVRQEVLNGISDPNLKRAVINACLVINRLLRKPVEPGTAGVSVSSTLTTWRAEIQSSKPSLD